jgi:hypothetical protein
MPHRCVVFAFKALRQFYAKLHHALEAAEIGKMAEVAILTVAQLRLGNLVPSRKTLAATRTDVVYSEDLPIALDLTMAGA